MRVSNTDADLITTGPTTGLTITYLGYARPYEYCASEELDVRVGGFIRQNYVSGVSISSCGTAVKLTIENAEKKLISKLKMQGGVRAIQT